MMDDDLTATEFGRLRAEVARRRTFAIISHPDAGKTTLTEKLLLLGGVVHLAGAVKATRGRAAALSDWMALERERGISVTTSVLQFPYEGLRMTLLDTPGHADFGEDTYRTLHAVDSAVMLLDRAKGVEVQTKRLFRICRQRQIPILSVVNKVDRPGRDGFDLIGEVEDTLGVGVYPMTWPIFVGDRFRGVYDRRSKRAVIYPADRAGSSAAMGSLIPPSETWPLDAPELRDAIGSDSMDRLRDEIALLDAAGDRFDHAKYRVGEVSPMFFASAINNFGLEPFLRAFADLMPAPQGRRTRDGATVAATEPFSAFVFKIQANMDPAHRDRVAFARICSGRFERGMKVRHVRAGREIRINNPSNFLAQTRTLVDEAFAGDVIGLHDTGLFEIGDTITGAGAFEFEAVPAFSPEKFSRVVLADPMRRKQLARGLEQLSTEGTVQLYRPLDALGGEVVLGAVGELQFEVVKYRLESEYGVRATLEPARLETSRWVFTAAGGHVADDRLRTAPFGLPTRDVRGRAVLLFQNEWQMRKAIEAWPEMMFTETASAHTE
jgi:peptide chain release factor 3